MPDGQPAPVSHQHADDTTLHVFQPSDAQAALDSSIALFCAATCSQLNVSKSRGFLAPAQQVLDALFCYHGSFQRPSEQLLKQLSQQLRKFVASAQQANQSDDAVALAQGCSEGSAHLPCSGPKVALFGSPAPCPCPRGVWGLCMCRHKSKPCRQR